MSTPAAREPRFEWDFDIPQQEFWKDLDYSISRNFLQCYTKTERNQLPLDDSLSKQGKLVFLLKTLDRTLATKETESRSTHKLPLKDFDNAIWRNILLGLSNLEHALGSFEMEEELTRERYENGPDGTKDMSALQELSVVMERRGKFAEGQLMAQEALQWMDEHPKLGRDSPQAISVACILATCVWKQKRFEEGERLLKNVQLRIDDMGAGKFSKYHQEETKALRSKVVALHKWRDEHDTKEI